MKLCFCRVAESHDIKITLRFWKPGARHVFPSHIKVLKKGGIG